MYDSFLRVCTGEEIGSPWRRKGRIYIRSIYIWNALGLFYRNRRGGYEKPTEGISVTTYNNMKGIMRRNPKGFWLWIGNTKDTDIERPRGTRIYGAVYVSGIMKTEEYKRRYDRKRLYEMFKESREGEYQLIIPMREEARRELLEPLEIHEYKQIDGENRQGGVWEPSERSRMWERLREVRYI